MPNKNASIAVALTDSVMMAVFLEDVGPQEVSEILIQSYRSKEDATELVVLGDFHRLSPDISKCGHFIKQGDDIGDCMPEIFTSYKAYEETVNSCSYGYNYVLRDGIWWQLVAGKKPKYKKLKRKRDGSKKESS